MRQAFVVEPGAGHGRWLKSLCLAFLCLLLASAPCSGADEPSLAAALARADELQLHRDRYWEILLHYKPSPAGRTSLIDDPRFFLAARGKNDPAAELAATLTALFRPPGEGEEAARCRFPARFAWLAERLGLDESRLPPAACTELQSALDKARPRSAVLIFPGTHNNSPASMFGHTLICIDGPYESRLLSYAVNYSAFTDESNGFAYAVKGIFGLYRGYYSVLPYYQKVKEYNDLERRDVWEYPLNLSADEVRRMFLHIWELRNVYSDYYFFDENCSYNLLFLLEAARPTLNLTDQCRPWVIPVDTVRIARENGLLAEAIYRPSKATRIEHIAGEMNGTEQLAAEEVIAGRLDPAGLAGLGLSPAGRIRVLDLAAEAVEFRYFRKELDRDAYRRQYLSLLAERSRLGRAEEMEAPVPGRPDAGHGSNRLGLGVGLWKDEPFAELQLRPAYHNLLDADDGYLAGSQIDFANLALRYYPERAKVELHALDLINIVSISPRHPFFKPVSWKVETGFRQKTFENGDDHLVYALNPGGGFAWRAAGGISYLLFESDLQVGGRFRDGFALGLGGSAGFLRELSGRWKAHLWGRGIAYELGEPHRGGSLHLDQSFRLGSDSALALKASRHREFGNGFSEVVLGWNLFW